MQNTHDDAPNVHVHEVGRVEFLPIGDRPLKTIRFVHCERAGRHTFGITVVRDGREGQFATVLREVDLVALERAIAVWRRRVRDHRAAQAPRRVPPPAPPQRIEIVGERLPRPPFAGRGRP
jgi:hypothetical protein